MKNISILLSLGLVLSLGGSNLLAMNGQKLQAPADAKTQTAEERLVESQRRIAELTAKRNAKQASPTSSAQSSPTSSTVVQTEAIEVVATVDSAKGPEGVKTAVDDLMRQGKDIVRSNTFVLFKSGAQLSLVPVIGLLWAGYKTKEAIDNGRPQADVAKRIAGLLSAMVVSSYVNNAIVSYAWDHKLAVVGLFTLYLAYYLAVNHGLIKAPKAKVPAAIAAANLASSSTANAGAASSSASATASSTQESAARIGAIADHMSVILDRQGAKIDDAIRLGASAASSSPSAAVQKPAAATSSTPPFPQAPSTPTQPNAKAAARLANLWLTAHADDRKKLTKENTKRSKKKNDDESSSSSDDE